MIMMSNKPYKESVLMLLRHYKRYWFKNWNSKHVGLFWDILGMMINF